MRLWRVLGFVAVALTVHLTLVLSPLADIYLGPPSAPDTRTGGYGPADFQALLLVWGDEGRTAYLHASRTIDAAIPLVMGSAFLVSLWALVDGWEIGGRRISGWHSVAIASLAIVPSLLDYLENHLVTRAVAAGPGAFNPGSIELASLVTQTKIVTSGALFAFIIALSILRFRQWRRDRKSRTGSESSGPEDHTATTKVTRHEQ